jgi:hypothetical protein
MSATPKLALNADIVTNSVTSFADPITGGSWYFYNNGGGSVNPTNVALTKDTGNKVIMFANSGTALGFLSYGVWNQTTLQYPTANTVTGIGALHTVIMIFYRYGAVIGSGGEGSGNACLTQGILYMLGRSSAYNYPNGVSGTYTGEIVVGENGAWSYGFGPSGGAGYTGGLTMNSLSQTWTNTPGWVFQAFAFRQSGGVSTYYRVRGSGGSWTVTTQTNGNATCTNFVDGALYLGVDQRDTYYNSTVGNQLNAGLAYCGVFNAYLTSSDIQYFANNNLTQFGATFV